ncbi:MAG: thiamine pyrophosphate-dependent enzyme [Litoreibacter sp.]|nr:thiamine pyrophosphate-dependent enzyme [Litoreibacter sp.]
MDRVEIVHQNFLTRVASGDLPKGKPACGALSNDAALSLFHSQVLSRQLDRVSREMQKAGEGFYTIGSSGHEGMAAVAHALRPTDIAFLHYRDAAFQIARAAQVGHDEIARDMLMSFACRAADPISGGRHKVLGSLPLMIPPQTSTIASHLPKAVGMAFSIGAARRRKPEHQLVPDDAISVCSFGDASLNHSTAQGAINTAGWTAVQSTPLPLLMICEDNGIGISTKTPLGWVEASMRHRPGLRYFTADALDMFETYRVTQEAADFVRRTRTPAFLHLKMVRLYGHAGADVATSYLPKAEVEAEEAQDPLLHSVRLLSEAGALTHEEAIKLYDETLTSLEALRDEVAKLPPLSSAAEVAESLIPPKRICQQNNGPTSEERAAAFGADAKQLSEPQPMSRLINWALTDLMLEHGEITLMGEDVGRKGGVYGVTQKLQSRFGPDRVIDTLLDEQSILGLAIGMAHNGFIPIPEIQFLAYLHNAEDQLRGEAATLPFFSKGQFTNPMVIRIAGLGYQKGFGGHFHNDNSIAVLRDIPGVIIACPSNGEDAAKMLRECFRLAREEQRVVVFLEPIALYPMRDLDEPGDGGWMRAYPAPSEWIALGEVGVHGEGRDLAILTYGNGAYLSQQAQAKLAAEGIKARIIDLRWLAPLPLDAVLEQVSDCDHVLIVDECRRTGSQSEGLLAGLFEAGRTALSRITAEDCFIATGPAYAAPLPSVDAIVKRARILCKKTP